MKKTLIAIMFLSFLGMIVLPGCSKETKLNVPLSLTDKDGHIFIQIDTVNYRFDAYSATRITTGRLKGVFNDTVRSSFNLAILTEAVWDTVYHPQDTIILPTLFPNHSLVIQTDVNLINFTSPYHFILLNMHHGTLKSGPHGNPSILLTIDTGN